MEDATTLFEEKLRAIQQRMRWLAVARWFVRAVGAGLLVALALLVVQSVGMARDINILAIAGVVAALVAMAAPLLEKLPSQSDAARLADQLLEGQERFSTAHEAGQRRPPGVVEKALLTQVRLQAGALLPARLVPVPLMRLLAPVGVLVSVVVIAAVLLPPAPTPDQFMPLSVPEEHVAALADDERAGLAEDIQRVAAFMNSQAEMRNDDYALAVARTLEGLGTRLASDDSISRDQATAELDSLREYAMAATSGWRGTAGQRIPELLEALVDRLDLAQQLAAPAVKPATVAGEKQPMAMAPPEPGQPSPRSQQPSDRQAPGQKSSDFEAMMADAEAAVANNSSDAASAAGEPAPRVGSYLDVAQAQNEAEMAMAGTEIGDNAEIIGPSSNVQAGDSLLAGEGTDAVTGGPLEATPLEFEAAGEMSLEASDSGVGQRIEKDIAPPSQLSVVADPTDRSAMASWSRQREAVVGRTSLGANERDLVSAYRLGLRAQVEQ